MFERDFAHASPPWGQYTDTVGRDVDELMSLPPDTLAAPWLSPSSRRGGAGLIEARRGLPLRRSGHASATGRSSAALVSTSTADVLSDGRTVGTYPVVQLTELASVVVLETDTLPRRRYW